MKIVNMDIIMGDNGAVSDSIDISFIGVNRIDQCRLSKWANSGTSLTICPKNTNSSSDDEDDYSNDIKVIKVIYNDSATIIFWSDGTKTVVKCDKDDTYDPEKGFYIACAKKLFGNNYKAVGRMNKALAMAVTKGENPCS